MDWRVKCAAFQMLRWVPARRTLHRVLQKRITGRYLHTVTDADLAAYGVHVEHYRRLSRPGRALEFGAGSNLMVSLLLSHAGAEEVLAYDLERLATLEQVNHVIRQLRGRLAGSWPEIRDLDSDLLARYRIRYVAPGDVRATQLPPASVDFVCSSSVLEHIAPGDIATILTECKRIGTTDSLASFIIDYHDHYSSADPSINRFNFYRYGDRAWRILNPPNHFQNRLRHIDYEDLFAAHTFALLESRRVIPKDSPSDFSGVAPTFRRYRLEDLTSLNGFFLLGLGESAQAKHSVHSVPPFTSVSCGPA